MADYRIGMGWDLPYAGLVVISQEPKGGLVTPVSREYGVSSRHHEQAHFVMFEWDFIESPDAYITLLGQFGLSVDGNDSSNVTVHARSERLIWKRYNGIAHLPEIGTDAKWDNFFFRNVKIYITDLEELA